MSKKVNLAVAATVTLIAMAVTFSITMVVSMNMFNDIVTGVKNREQMYNKLSEIDRYVRNNEYADINEDTLNDTIASGYMLGISDPYARYYSAAAYTERVGLENGRLMGVGVSIIKDATSGYARILRVYDGSPAAENGLQAGGFITSVNGASVRTMTDTAAVNSALTGESGSTVTLGYLTPDRQEQSFDLVRTNYTVATVFPQLLENGVGYVDIDSFAEGSGLEFRTAVDNLIGQGATSFVFDLRDNTGDDLNAALIAADYCVPAGLIAQSQAKDGTVTDLRVSDDHEITAPVVCLVNSGTAGGAELFANALRRMSGASLIGRAAELLRRQRLRDHGRPAAGQRGRHLERQRPYPRYRSRPDHRRAEQLLRLYRRDRPADQPRRHRAGGACQLRAGRWLSPIFRSSGTCAPAMTFPCPRALARTSSSTPASARALRKPPASAPAGARWRSAPASAC